MNKNEKIIFDIILHAGNARSSSIKAYKLLEYYDFFEAEKLLKEASISLNTAHKVQTELMQKEVRGENQDVTLLMVHAQDHVMAAQTIRDIVVNSVKIIKELDSRLNKLESRKNDE